MNTLECVAELPPAWATRPTVNKQVRSSSQVQGLHLFQSSASLLLETLTSEVYFCKQCHEMFLKKPLTRDMPKL